MQKVTYIKTDYNELEQLIFDTFGVRYEILAGEEVGSSQHAAYMTITTEPEIEEYEEERFSEFLAGEPIQYVLSTLLSKMANNLDIEHGTYLIGVNW